MPYRRVGRACFHAQQAAEKPLTSVLAVLGTDFPRSRSLERLAALHGSEDAIFERSVPTSPVGGRRRYPEGLPEPT